MKVDLRKFNSRIKENKSKLLLQTSLPHLVSTVSQIFELENQEQVEVTGLKQNKPQKEISKDAMIKTSKRIISMKLYYIMNANYLN